MDDGSNGSAGIGASTVRRIRHAVRERGWTMHRFLMESGLHASSLSRWEKGRLVPEEVSVLRAARALGMRPEVLAPEWVDQAAQHAAGILHRYAGGDAPPPPVPTRPDTTRIADALERIAGALERMERKDRGR